jgi:hypothetical protein
MPATPRMRIRCWSSQWSRRCCVVAVPFLSPRAAAKCHLVPVYAFNSSASLLAVKHRIGGRTYWRIVKSRRIRGEPPPRPARKQSMVTDYDPRVSDSPCRMRAEKSGESPAAFALSVMLLRARSSSKGRRVSI